MAQELAKFHLSREYDNKITVFRFEDLHPNTVQLWGEHVLKFKDRPIPEGTRLLCQRPHA